MGGEAKLKEAVAYAKSMGYQIVGHSSFRDCYMIADTWDLEYVVEKNPDKRYSLKLAEFGGRPTFYWHSWFVTGRPPSMGTWDLEATTDVKMRQGVRWMKEGHDEYIRRNALQFAFMERHEKIADGVFRVTYSNGAKMYVNYNDSPTVMDGMSIPAMDYVLSAGK